MGNTVATDGSPVTEELQNNIVGITFQHVFYHSFVVYPEAILKYCASDFGSGRDLLKMRTLRNIQATSTRVTIEVARFDQNMSDRWGFSTEVLLNFVLVFYT